MRAVAEILNQTACSHRFMPKIIVISLNSYFYQPRHAFSLHSRVGAILASNGKSFTGVGREQPMIILTVQFRDVSSFLRWALRHILGRHIQQHCRQVKKLLFARCVCVCWPRVDPFRHLKMSFLASMYLALMNTICVLK